LLRQTRQIFAALKVGLICLLVMRHCVSLWRQTGAARFQARSAPLNRLCQSESDAWNKKRAARILPSCEPRDGPDQTNRRMLIVATS
jgi:hypothetical protein